MSSRSFTGYPFTGRRFTGYPFTGVQFGEVIDGLDILALFYKGSIPYYTSYTREGLAYTSAGTFAQDVPPYEIVEGEKRFVQYEGTNIVPDPEDPSSFLAQGGSSYSPLTREFTIPQGGTVIFAFSVSSVYRGNIYTGGLDLVFISGVSVVLSLNDGVDTTGSAITGSGPGVVSKAYDAASTRNSFFVINPNATTAVIKIEKIRENIGPYLLPYIPVGNTPVNKGTTSLLAEDDGAELARLPWVSPLGTKYGVKGALNGVDGNPATFSIPFTKYIPHGTTEDLPFVQHTTNDFVPLYRELTTGLIKGTDGTNTCVSTAAATEGSTVSGWFSFNGPQNEMWITLDGVKGAISTCLDALPDVGNRLFGLTSGTYQSIENLYIDNELPLQTGQGIWNTPLSAIKDNLLSDIWNTPLKEM